MEEPNRIDRRAAIKWMLAATAAMPLIEARSLGAPPAPQGYGTDPNLMEAYKPGELWPLIFTAEQRRTAAALCDVIIPADERSPSASALHVQDFIDEWISAPYPKQREDRKTVLTGLAWLDAESKQRFQKPFEKLTEAEQHQICDEICYAPTARRGLKDAVRFFAKFRTLTTGGFYTTPEGMKDIQYVGNVPLTSFEGPPPEVLAFLKLG